MSEFVKVAKSEELPSGTMKKFSVSGTDVLVVNAAGHLYGVSTLCTHDNGPLDEGMLKDTSLVCPWHGSMFDVANGEVLVPPAPENLTIYEVKVENGEIFVKV